MNLYKLFFIFIFYPFLVYGQGEPALTFGGQKEDIGYDIISCSDGGYLLGGSTKSFGAGNQDIYLVKLDSEAHTQWIKTIGWEHDDMIRSITEIDDGFILVGDAWDFGHSRLDVYTLKIDFQGNIVWDKQYGSNSKDIGFDVLELDDKSLLILGYSREIDPAGDILLIKTDDTGNELWRNFYGTNYDDYGIEVKKFDTDKFLIAGTKAGFYDEVYSTYFNSHDADVMLICVDENSNELWKQTYGGEGHDFGYSVTNIGNDIYICGSTQSEGNGSFDMLLLKTDSQGNKLWSKTFGGNDYEYGLSMVKNQENGLYLCGTTKSFGQNQSSDFYLIKTDSSGNELWNLTFGGDSIDIAYKISSTADSGIIVIGKTNSFGNGYYDMMVLKVDKNGVIQDLISGIDTTYINEIQLYPNPLSGIGRIRYLSNIEVPELYIELISISGKVISSFKVISPDYSFNSEHLDSGTYVYRVRKHKNSSVIFTGKLIIR